LNCINAWITKTSRQPSPKVILLAKSFEHYYDTSASKWSHAATWKCIMLRPMPIEPVPHETARIARAAFPKGHRYLRLADEIETWFTDDAFRALCPTHGQPAWPPWRLALATILHFAEGRSDR